MDVPSINPLRSDVSVSRALSLASLSCSASKFSPSLYNLPLLDATLLLPLKEKPQPEMSSREQVMKLLEELQEIFPQFYMLLIGFIVAMNPDTGTLLFTTKQRSLMIALLVIIVLYFLVLVLGTVLQFQLNIRKYLPVFTVILLILGSAVSVMALSMISVTIAWITLGLWVGFFAFLVYYYLIPLFSLSTTMG